MAHKHLGVDFTPHDVVAKVTGEAKYAEDFRAEGMVFARMLTSPYPHASVKKIDASEALKMPGVVGILTADEVKNPPDPEAPLLTNEPRWIGAPILLVAAEDETTAQDAIEKIRIDYETARVHTSIRSRACIPTSPMRALDGNVGAAGVKFQKLKWTKDDFDKADKGRMPMGKAAQEWAYGDVEAGFKRSQARHRGALRPREQLASQHGAAQRDGVLAERQVLSCTCRRRASRSSTPALAGMIGIPPTDLVVIAEYCGGGFGSKGGAYTHRRRCRR